MEVISGKVKKAKKVVLYGPEGIGKSSLAAQFPNPIFMDTEGSTTEMDVQRLAKPTSWEMVRQQVNWVKQQSGRFGTLVMDTVDWAEMLCAESVCAQYGKKGIEDFGYGNGYVYAKEEFGRFLNLLSDVIEAGIHVVLVAHSQIIKFEQPDEMGAYDRYQLKLGKKTSSQTAPLVKEWADMVLFINYKTFSVATDDKGRKHKGQGGARTVYATHHPAWDAKNRHGLPDEFPLDFAYLAPIFNGCAKTPAPAAAVHTPSEPVQQEMGQMASGQLHYKPPAAEQARSEMSELNPNIPPSLRDLMIQHQVKEYEIQMAVGKRGYFPQDTPIVNYGSEFIEAALVGAWPKVLEAIEAARKELPF